MALSEAERKVAAHLWPQFSEYNREIQWRMLLDEEPVAELAVRLQEQVDALTAAKGECHCTECWLKKHESSTSEQMRDDLKEQR